MLLLVTQFIILIREDQKKIHFGTFHISLIPRQSLYCDRPAICSQVAERKKKKILAPTTATTFVMFASKYQPWQADNKTEPAVHGCPMPSCPDDMLCACVR